MFSTRRPYIIIPKLIEQPTWGADYILKMKKWNNKSYLTGKKIGQSYELFSKSKLLNNITDSTDPRFIAELGSATGDKTLNDNFDLQEGSDYIFLPNIPVPLIKFTQAAGNSFQLHIAQNIKNVHWKPKAESWYYFENGLITFGIKENINLDQYKEACKSIESKMKNLSKKIKDGLISLEKAIVEAKEFINGINPWQYVNVCEVKKGSVVDLSGGGIHHSWEENKDKYPIGNVLYEIQQDVMDPVSTLRSFDQGKISNDGSIREIHIDDYFKYLDTNQESNNIDNATRQKQGSHLLSTSNYSLDILEIKDKLNDSTNNSFCHLFVREGDVEIIAEEGRIHLTQGHSCFLPQNAGAYEIKSKTSLSVILKTFVEV